MLVQAHTCVAPVMRTEDEVPERRALRGRRKMSDRAQGEWLWGTCFRRYQDTYKATAMKSEWCWPWNRSRSGEEQTRWKYSPSDERGSQDTAMLQLIEWKRFLT